MHKHFKFHLRHGIVDGTNLVYAQLAGQHGATEALLPQPRHLVGSAVVGLRGGMQL